MQLGLRVAGLEEGPLVLESDRLVFELQICHFLCYVTLGEFLQLPKLTFLPCKMEMVCLHQRIILKIK